MQDCEKARLAFSFARLRLLSVINTSIRDVQTSLIKANIEATQDFKTYQDIKTFLAS